MAPFGFPKPRIFHARHACAVHRTPRGGSTAISYMSTPNNSPFTRNNTPQHACNGERGKTNLLDGARCICASTKNHALHPSPSVSATDVALHLDGTTNDVEARMVHGLVPPAVAGRVQGTEAPGAVLSTLVAVRSVALYITTRNNDTSSNTHTTWADHTHTHTHTHTHCTVKTTGKQTATTSDDELRYEHRRVRLHSISLQVDCSAHTPQTPHSWPQRSSFPRHHTLCGTVMQSSQHKWVRGQQPHSTAATWLFVR